MKEAVNIIKESDNILIMTHKNPDGDAVGSVLGLWIGLIRAGKDATCFFKDQVPSIFSFLPKISMAQRTIEPKNYDLLVLLDCDSISRAGISEADKVYESFDRMLIIDHHPKSENGDCKNKCLKVINPAASCTAVMIYDLLKMLKIEITKDIAICIFTGIFADTGSFQHSNTDEKTLKVAAELMKKGARAEKIAKQIFKNRTMSAIKLWGKALSRVETDKETGMAVSYLSKKELEEYNVSPEELSGLVGIINTISDAKFSLFLTEYGERKIKGSLRSEEYKGIDVSRIARSLGGGGHKLASGFEMEGEIEESIKKITKMIQETKKF